MSETIIQVENLSKRYVIGHQRLKDDGLRHVIEEAVRSPFRWLNGQRGKHIRTKEEFWALKGVSFEVKKGDVLGIIGRNGAGKSTLLKILSRITEPTSGRITIDGRIASLLEVGTGFHPELTGRENIFLNGAILGMSKVEIKRKFDEIVAFSEIEKFLDTPVKRYSSGMYVRLAFAVAAHLEPEILIVDEVLAVGDAAFQKKCLGKMDDVARGGRTVLFVSHNMGVISSLCKKAVWFESGSLKHSGEARSTVQSYLSDVANDSGQFRDLALIPRQEGYGEKMRLLSIEWLTGYPVQHGATIKLVMRCGAMTDCLDVSAGIGISNLEGLRLLTYDTDLVANSRHKISRGEQVRFEIEIPDLPVSPGIYSLDLGIRSGDMHQLDYMPGAVQMEVVPGANTPPFIIRQGAGIRLPSTSRIVSDVQSS